jgi:predicted metal-dependent hydrolase
LRIDPTQGQVVVTLPMRARRADGEALLARNAAWVAGRLAALPCVPCFADGATVPIDGTPHRIRHVARGRGAWLEKGALHVAGDETFLRKRVHVFLRAEAARRLGEAARAKAASAGLKVQRVTVRDTKSRWGSCSPRGGLMFCWRLLMAPAFVQDYVIAHEVAHLRHLDHGAAFWALAETLSPHRRAATEWLAVEGPALLRVA